MVDSNIDFVVLWVNPKDPKWIKSKNKYVNDPINEDDGQERYRDFDTIRYFFRSIDKYAPWVHKIFFITYGHIPDWLDTDNEKIRIVDHEEFIPHKYLPTFNSNTIELNLHRIPDLSENFVLFNDDFMLTNEVKPDYFFKDGIPRDYYVETPLMPLDDGIFHIVFNNMRLVNREFTQKRKFALKNIFKIINYKNSYFNIRNLVMLLWGNYSNFYTSHVSQAYLKSSFAETWSKYEKELNLSCKNRFRSETDLNHWLVRIRQVLLGKFVPKRVNDGKYLSIANIEECRKVLFENKVKEVCLNDSEVTNFGYVHNEIDAILEKKYPQKSCFEK